MLISFKVTFDRLFPPLLFTTFRNKRGTNSKHKSKHLREKVTGLHEVIRILEFQTKQCNRKQIVVESNLGSHHHEFGHAQKRALVRSDIIRNINQNASTTNFLIFIF